MNTCKCSLNRSRVFLPSTRGGGQTPLSRKQHSEILRNSTSTLHFNLEFILNRHLLPHLQKKIITKPEKELLLGGYATGINVLSFTVVNVKTLLTEHMTIYVINFKNENIDSPSSA